MSQPRLHITPIDLRLANLYVRGLHRHHKPTVGHRFSIGVADETGVIRGVAIVSRPVARGLDNGANVEVTRVATDGCENACSALYGACARIAREMGYQRIYTYTLDTEPGTSLRAAGWALDGATTGGNWNVPSRPRSDSTHQEAKQRWCLELRRAS